MLFNSCNNNTPTVYDNDSDSHNILSSRLNSNKKNKNFSCILINIRSVRKNFYHLLAYINNFSTLPEIIFLTEIWISSSEISNYNVDGYQLYANCNDDYRAGGCAVLIRNQIEHNFSALIWTAADVGKLSLNFMGKIVTFLIIYRLQTQQTDLFINELEQCLCSINVKNFFVLGDVNLDILKSSPIIDEYQLLMSGHGLSSFVNEPTRIVIELNGNRRSAM